ncbi:MAG: mannose-1-phosphate guanylyltransferase [Bifidobacteriaceae bacterium]|jgi:mannose-1-phosphate guanylyltransferase|nr:mannose-1-phosphate guanylyltransferase [Bifidobacteriaceae bacterium]
MSSPLPGFGVIIPAGGAGKRLWPISTAARPKFLLDLTGQGRSLLRQAWDRLEPLAGAGQVTVVTGEAHVPAVTAQLAGLRADNLIAEPRPHDSMPAIALAAAIMRQRIGEVVLGSFAADHVIGDVAAFNKAVEAAYLTAKQGLIATIGIKPTEPSQAYGYIADGEPLGLDKAPRVKYAAAFKEKPDQATAEAYLKTGRYRWNAGMFVFRASLLFELLHQWQPELAAGIDELAAVWDTPKRAEALERIWPELPSIAIDYAVAEPAAKAGLMATVPGDFPWSDLGSYDSLRQATKDGSLRLVPGEPAILDGSAGSFVVSQTGQTVALLGVPDIVVAVSGDVVLVAGKDQAERIKDLASEAGRNTRSGLKHLSRTEISEAD